MMETRISKQLLRIGRIGGSNHGGQRLLCWINGGGGAAPPMNCRGRSSSSGLSPLLPPSSALGNNHLFDNICYSNNNNPNNYRNLWSSPHCANQSRGFKWLAGRTANSGSFSSDLRSGGIGSGSLCGISSGSGSPSGIISDYRSRTTSDRYSDIINQYQCQQVRYHHRSTRIPLLLPASSKGYTREGFASVKTVRTTITRQCSGSAGDKPPTSSTSTSISSTSPITSSTSTSVSTSSTSVTGSHQQHSPLSTSTTEKVPSPPDPNTVTLGYLQGLPHLTIPLPSRRELCRFTLRPVTHTVASLVTQLQNEDKGIDRVMVKTTDGVRIASSASIESLLLSDFELIINDVCYRVTVPLQYRATLEEVTDLDDVRQLVNKLYAALNVDEHQIGRERDILREMEDIKTQLIPMEKHRAKLVAAAERRTNVVLYSGLSYMAVQFGFLAPLTWWEYSWDIMEPVTYFVTYGTAIACYAYYVLTKHDFILPEVRDRQFLLGFHRKARKTGLDVVRYNGLKDRHSALEADLRRLRDPLMLNLPPQHLAKIIADEAEQNLSKSSPLTAFQQQLKALWKMNRK